MLIYTNTRSKVKPKLKSKAVRQDYEAWCKKHGIENKKRREKTSLVAIPAVVTAPYIRQTEKYSSLSSFVTGPVSMGISKNTYTGDQMLGIAAMHKSNLVPIFTSEGAKDVSTMRRN